MARWPPLTSLPWSGGRNIVQQKRDWVEPGWTRQEEPGHRGRLHHLDHPRRHLLPLCYRWVWWKPYLLRMSLVKNRLWQVLSVTWKLKSLSKPKDFPSASSTNCSSNADCDDDGSRNDWKFKCACHNLASKLNYIIIMIVIFSINHHLHKFTRHHGWLK